MVMGIQLKGLSIYFLEADVMNFVIFSYHFLPKGDAESFCTTRFCSALARAGHNVTVVTMDWGRNVSQAVCDFLIDKNLQIVRVPITAKGRPPFWYRLRYITDEYGCVDFRNCINVLEEVLKKTDNPILISRACPWASFIVAWHCRKYAVKWISHFSDPLSYLSEYDFRTRLLVKMAKFWIRRVLKSADAISLTCESVKRYYHDFYGKAFDLATVFVTHHIGNPRLPCYTNYEFGHKTKNIVHIGYLSTGRGAGLVAQAITRVNEEGIRCRFYQCGPVDCDVKSIVESSPYMELLSDSGPDFASAVCAAADAVLIADQDTEFGYIPFCASKFAYQVFSDKPLIALTRVGSTMEVCASKFPCAGLFWGSFGDVDSLRNAIKSALVFPIGKIDRTGLRLEFDETVVAEKFVKDVELVLQKK